MAYIQAEVGLLPGKPCSLLHTVLVAIRYRRQPYRTAIIRVVQRAGRKQEITLAKRDGRWGELAHPDDLESWLPSPGARDLTIREYVGSAARRVRSYGEWGEVPADVAHSEQRVLDWCRRHANSELPSGTFRLGRLGW